MNGNTQVSSFRLPAGGSFTLDDVADTADNRFLGFLGDAGFSATWNATTEKWDCTYNGTDIAVRITHAVCTPFCYFFTNPFIQWTAVNHTILEFSGRWI